MSQIPLYGAEGFEGMRRAGQLAGRVLDFIQPHVQAGITTQALDTLCHDFICDHGAIPAPLGYNGFPKSICTSVNHVVCHGIPGATVLKNGDILNIDVSVIVDGWYGDTARMFVLEPVPTRVRQLVQATYEALQLAIACVRPGAHLGDIGHAIQKHVESHGFSVVRDYCGHGIGRVFHGPPEVLHFGRPGQGIVLQEGMFFTIEPMINMGAAPVILLKDGWTVVTKDRKPSAQFEHTLGVTADGCEVMTLG